MRYFWNGEFELPPEPVPFDYFLDDESSIAAVAEDGKPPSCLSNADQNDSPNIAAWIVPVPHGWIFRPNPPIKNEIKRLAEYIFDRYASGGNASRVEDLMSYKCGGKGHGRNTVKKYTELLSSLGLIEHQDDVGYIPTAVIRARLDSLGPRTKPEPK